MNIIVHHAQLVNQPPEPQWQLSIEVQHDDGTSEQLGHIMPVTAVEWRVAQYNVDPETAIKMLLAEPYMVPTDNVLPDLQPTRSGARSLQAARVDDALRGGHIAFQEGDPLFLMTDPEVPQEVLVESGTDSPLATIVDNSPVSDDHLEVKREYMDGHREIVRASVAPVNRNARRGGPSWTRQTAEELRATLRAPDQTRETEA